MLPPRPEQPGFVLVVDNDEESSRRIAELLRQIGCQCATNTDAESAVKQAALHHADVVILEPATMGRPGADHVRSFMDAIAPRPLIVVTRDSDLRFAVEIFNLGVAGYFLKPVSGEDLLAAVGLAIKRLGVLRALETGRTGMEHRFLDLDGAVKDLVEKARPAPVLLRDFVKITLHDLMGSILDLERVLDAALMERAVNPDYRLDFIPKRVFLDAVKDAIATIEGTRSSFKSRELAALRLRLQAAIDEAG